MFGGRSSKIVVNAKKGVAADVSCSTNFAYSSSPARSSTASSTVKTVAGINTTITLRVDVISNTSGGTIFYVKNGGSDTSIVNGGTFTVVNGDTLLFRYTSIEGSFATFNVINQSDSNTNLGQIGLYLQ